MDVLDMLKNEDDNPRGQTSRFRGGNTLEEAGEAEQRRRDIQAMRWPIMKQEAGIVHLIQAKNFFQRLQLPEPRRNVEGEVTWVCSEATLQRAYDTAKMCCDPEWAHHPQRDRGFKAERAAAVIASLARKDKSSVFLKEVRAEDVPGYCDVIKEAEEEGRQCSQILAERSWRNAPVVLGGPFWQRDVERRGHRWEQKRRQHAASMHAPVRLSGSR